jgi:uncharacterized protein YndB with AHSA1/START domain
LTLGVRRSASAEGDASEVDAERTTGLKFTNTIMIERPTSEVFAYLANFENLPRWNYAITETHKITPSPVGVGSRYVQLRTVPTRSEETFEVVVEFEPDHRLAVRGAFGALSGYAGYLLEPTGNATKLTNTTRLHSRAARCPRGTAGHPEGAHSGRRELPQAQGDP